MKPVYNVGDVIIEKEVSPSDLKVGDDITYLGREGDFAGKIVTHRIQKIEKAEDGTYKIVTKGVANVLEDPEITDAQIQGKVLYKIRTLSFLSNVINKSLAVMYIWIFIPIGLIIFINIRRLYLDATESKEEKENEKEENNNKE